MLLKDRKCVGERKSFYTCVEICASEAEVLWERETDSQKGTERKREQYREIEVEERDSMKREIGSYREKER